ncbi:MAG: winged helix DNA-binding domain-containing protein [Actinomycetia bacterium]|nr:winged helix DNA-binding domain-containing protein [Actinomycetes bacterium]
MKSIDTAERRARIGVRHRLTATARSDDPAKISDALVAFHSSDPATVYLSATSRMRTPSVEVVEQGFYETRTLIRHHAMRRTLWAMTPEVAALAHAASTRSIVDPQVWRLSKLIEESGIAHNGESWIAEARVRLLDAVRSVGPVSTRELGLASPDLAVSLRFGGGSVSAHSRILLILGFEGTIVRTQPSGRWTNSHYAWVSAENWMPDLFDRHDEAAATAELIDRYLLVFGPATEKDIQWWTGSNITRVRTALQDVNAREVHIEGGQAWVSASDETCTSTDETWVAFLPGLDSTTMGWKERDWYVGSALAPRVFDRNGNAGPTVWADERVVGVWDQLASGEVVYRIYDPAAEGRSSDFARAAETVRDVYGDARHRVRFPSPAYRELMD